MAEKSVAMIVCNYNKADMVCDCIQALLEQRFNDYDLYVVDNASTDDSVEKIKSRYADKLTLIVNEENLGGSGGFNTGLKAAFAKGYPYYLCVDNDALLDECALGTLVEFLEAHPECGMAASKIYHLEQPDIVQNFGQKIDFDTFATQANYYGAYEDGSMPDYLYVDAVPACSLLVRRQTIEAIGFLPEDNFLYWDDTRWGYACNQAGMKVASVGASVALHSMGARKEDINTFPTYYAWRNWIDFFIRYTPKEQQAMMALTFLGRVFEEQFIGYRKDEYQKAATVMAAFDDALHHVTGKAAEGIIGNIDKNPARFDAVFCEAKEFFVEVNGYTALYEMLLCVVKERFPKVHMMTGGCVKGYTKIVLCESILSKDILDLAAKTEDAQKTYFIDYNECCVRADQANELYEHFSKARELFQFSHLPQFLRLLSR